MKNTTETSGESVEYHIKVDTCKDCKWWDGSSKDSYNECLNDKIYHYCPDYMERLPDALMVYYLEDSGGSIQTGPDFGCIHHDPKEKE